MKITFIQTAKVLVLIGAFFLLIRILEDKNMIDPLKESGLEDAVIRTYRYMQALYIKTFGEDAPPAVTEEDVIAAIQRFKPAKCTNPHCEQWFISERTRCSKCGFVTRTIDKKEFETATDEWEEFRTRYAKAMGLQTLSHRLAIKLSAYADRKEND